MPVSNDEKTALKLLQNQLHSALEAESAELAQIYFSALQVLSQTENKNRIYLAEHAIRQMLK